MTVCCTEKFNYGSILGSVRIRLDPATGAWGLLALHGRRGGVLWQTSDGVLWVPTMSNDTNVRERHQQHDVPTVKYGNAGSLRKLPLAAFRVVAAVTEEMSMAPSRPRSPSAHRQPVALSPSGICCPRDKAAGGEICEEVYVYMGRPSSAESQRLRRSTLWAWPSCARKKLGATLPLAPQHVATRRATTVRRRPAPEFRHYSGLLAQGEADD